MSTRLQISFTDHIIRYADADGWCLNRDLKDWLDERGIKYDFNYTYENVTKGNGCSHVSIRFFLDFEDTNDAIMFRIRWR